MSGAAVGVVAAAVAALVIVASPAAAAQEPVSAPDLSAVNRFFWC
jgi:hypothetical protein